MMIPLPSDALPAAATQGMLTLDLGWLVVALVAMVGFGAVAIVAAAWAERRATRIRRAGAAAGGLYGLPGVRHEAAR